MCDSAVAPSLTAQLEEKRQFSEVMSWMGRGVASSVLVWVCEGVPVSCTALNAGRKDTNLLFLVQVLYRNSLATCPGFLTFLDYQY